MHFYPRSPCGERPPRLSRVVPTPIFLSTLSLRRATQCRTFASGMYGFLSTLSLRRATKGTNSGTNSSIFLSTLSLRRATALKTIKALFDTISIHALLAESDPLVNMRNTLSPVFLSTLSLRRATSAGYNCHNARLDFYPRSPCGERLPPVDTSSVRESFLSTLSLRRATQTQSLKIPAHSISIHALLAESDRQGRLPAVFALCKFLSTLSLRRATLWGLMGGLSCDNFYPRSPCGERLSTNNHIGIRENFYPRSPCGERP